MQDLARFAGSAWYQSRYEPRMPARLVRHLVRELALDGSGRLLDVDCGIGELALRLVDWFEEAIALDPEWEQVMEGRREAATLHADRVRFIADPAELEPSRVGRFRLVAVRSSCRWLSGAAQVARLAALVDEHGALAAISSRREATPGWEALAELVGRWDGGLADEDEAFGRDVACELGDGFGGPERARFRVDGAWTAERLAGYLYATTGIGPRRLGEREDEFEAAVADLVAAHGGDALVERRTVEVVLWRRG